MQAFRFVHGMAAICFIAVDVRENPGELCPKFLLFFLSNTIVI